VTSPRLGSLWRLAPQFGDHIVLVATQNAGRQLHALLAVDRQAGPEDVVVGPGSVVWQAAPVPVHAIACRQQAVIAREWLSEELGELGGPECDAVGWLSSPPPFREGIPPPAPRFVGSAYTGLGDPRLAAVRTEAEVARGLLDAATSDEAAPQMTDSPLEIGLISRRLMDAVRRLIDGATDVIGVRLQPVPIMRGVEQDEPDRANLEIPYDGYAILGQRARGRVVIARGSVRISLYDVSGLAPGDIVVAAAVASTGRLFEARAPVEAGTTALTFDLEWPDADAPSDLVLVVIRG
jgi:hypothetical protein